MTQFSVFFYLTFVLEEEYGWCGTPVWWLHLGGSFLFIFSRAFICVGM